MSHPKYPIPGMQDGWISERVNSTDWWEPIGEIFCGSTWSKTSCMLSYAEIPGIYAVPDKGLVVVNDHLEAKMVKTDSGKLCIEITNKTEFDSTTSIYVETSGELKKPLGENILLNAERLTIKSGEKREFVPTTL